MDELITVQVASWLDFLNQLHSSHKKPILGGHKMLMNLSCGEAILSSLWLDDNCTSCPREMELKILLESASPLLLTDD